MLHFSKHFLSFLRVFRARSLTYSTGDWQLVCLKGRKMIDSRRKKTGNGWMLQNTMLRGFELCEEQACKTPKDFDHFACLSAYIGRALKNILPNIKKMLCAIKRVLLFSYVHFIRDMPYNFHRNFGFRKLRILYSRCKHPLNFVL